MELISRAFALYSGISLNSHGMTGTYVIIFINYSAMNNCHITTIYTISKKTVIRIVYRVLRNCYSFICTEGYKARTNIIDICNSKLC